MNLPRLTYDELRERLLEAEQVISSLLLAETDAVVLKNGVHVLRLYETDRALHAAHDLLDQMLNERTEQLGRELARTKQMAAELRDSEARFRTVAEAVPNLLWTTDPDGLNTYVSPRYEEFTGRPAPDLMAERWLSVLHPDDQERVEAGWAEALEKGQPFEAEYRLRRFDGSYRWFVVRGVPLRDQKGEISQWLGSSTEVDGMKRTEAALRRSNDELQQFAYAAAHDLQEPLRNISNSLGLLKRACSGLNAESVKRIDTAIEGTHRMHQMVKDLLSYVRAVESDEERPQLVPASEAVNTALANLGDRIIKSGAQIKVDPLPPVRVFETHLVQLFQNLVSNAIKYRRPDMQPEIRIAASKGVTECRFDVADNGIGFAPEYAQKIFGIFKRLHLRNEYAGTGIGLAICARVVAHYGGRIWAESQEGQGSTFRFTLPAE